LRTNDSGTAGKRMSTERKVQAGFAVALVCLGAIAVVSYLSVIQLRENAAWVEHTREVIGTLDLLFARATDAQSAHRGYVVTGIGSYLESYLQATRQLDATTTRLRQLTADNPAQRRRLAALAPLIEAQLAFGREVIALRRGQGVEAARDLMLTHRGEEIHDRIRSSVDEMKLAEETLLQAREVRARRSAVLAQSVIVGGGALALLFVTLALIAIRRDFAGRARAEAELERFFSLSLDFLVIANADGYFKRASPAVTDMLGWSVEEFQARPFMDFVHPDDHSATLAEVERQVVRGEKVLHFENRYRHKDGSWRVLSWRSMPQPGGLMYATARDVTQIRQTDQALREANEHLEARVRERTAELAQINESLSLNEARLQAQLERLNLLGGITRAIGERQDIRSIFQVVIRTLEDQLPVDFCCICRYDSHDNSVTVTGVGLRSEALAMELALTERARVEIDENGLSRCVRGQLVYEPDIGAVAFPFPQRLAQGGLRSLVAAPLIVESKVFGVLIAARLQANSFSSGDCEFLRQLSEHVALAAHQAQLYTALQDAYEELRQTQQAILQQERLLALGQMASGIAHDINNAISPVALYTESLLEKEPGLSPRTRSYLEIIQRAIDDVAQTVTRMREFYRQREPQVTLLPLDLNSMVGQVVDLTRARWSDMAQQRGVSITVHPELASGLPAIRGIEGEIREALTNLIFNAVDAMPNGGSLIVRTRLATRNGGDFIELDVSDSGIGMDEETRLRCLEPFFTTKGERGTGLGLAMVYGTMQRHGADIEVESAVGRGTTARLRFAVPDASLPAALPATDAEAVLKSLRILVVDDDPMLLRSLRDALEADEHSVTTANGGQAGIDAFLEALRAGQPYPLVVTDLGMPYVDGRKVAAAIKAAAPATAIILLTGWGQRMAAEGDIPPAVDRVLSKPPKMRELRAAFVQLLAHARL
jgi:PAS domain S-box-containing protein